MRSKIDPVLKKVSPSNQFSSLLIEITKRSVVSKARRSLLAVCVGTLRSLRLHKTFGSKYDTDHTYIQNTGRTGLVVYRKTRHCVLLFLEKPEGFI